MNGTQRALGTRDPVDPASGLKRSELQTLRESLQAKRAALQAAAQSRVAALHDREPALGDDMDQAAHNQAQALALRLADKEQALLAEVEHALTKFDAGTYGLCEGTDEPIGLGRLRARPWTRYSVLHKEQLERRGPAA